MNSVRTKEGVTKIESVKCSYTWKIENFLLNNKDNSEKICSPSFTIDENDKLKFHLAIFPREACADQNFVSLYLYNESQDLKLSVQYTFSIINKNKVKVHYVTQSCFFKPHGPPASGCFLFIKTEKLENDNGNLLPKKNLTICCDIEVGFNCRNFEVKTDGQAKCFNGECGDHIEVLEDFGNLLKTLELTDIVLKTSSEELKAHKTILAARSPVFLAMFTNNMLEKLESEIKITDFDTEVVSEMLKFMYTGKIENIEKNGIDLLRIADKYQILGLKKLCGNFLSSTLSIENASDLLIIADQCNSKDFKAKVIKFILSHKKEIISTSKFIDLKAKHCNLIAEIFFADS